MKKKALGKSVKRQEEKEEREEGRKEVGRRGEKTHALLKSYAVFQ